MADEINTDVTALTVQLLSAFVSNNTVSSEGLAELIKTTRSALTQDLSSPAAQVETPEFAPAVSVRKSISSRDHILSLIDGKPYKTLKRHLAQHGLTPEQYRERYKLPKSYPMVAPSYSDARRAVAEKLGLGKKPAVAPAEAASTAAPKAAAAKTPAKTAKPKASQAPDAKADVKPAHAKAAAAEKAAPRKRLSMFAPKEEKPTAPVEVKAEAPTAATSAPVNGAGKAAKAAAKAKPATKAKATPKPKAAKGDTKPAAPASVEAKAPEAAASIN
ncbi:hypothetical protein CAF53_23115 [Sphingobium sp. LB126]|uniref:MucR family transcriptional regulator n=1 Tax=Sphingobium sp. LB126 TaxID=1983755 RepID=UPI000C2080A0|nr:MucR family transcriptional regulator [Sphingobium sp. LB126]PJG45616.1 hypothetical protein CAF53_23115 [Sphingobium sp. LB126]